MIFLVDTNIFLEVLLEQERAEEAAIFLTGVDTARLRISNFSLFSIGIHLLRKGK